MPYAHSGQADIWWDSHGNGTPILLVNGLSSPSAVWFRLTPRLATRHRVLTFDNLGTGASSTPDEPWTLAMMADAAAAVITASGETAVAVLGISAGGLIAQQLTLEHPDLVLALILVSTHAGAAHLTGDPEAFAAIASAGTLPAAERVAFLAPFTYAGATPPERAAEDEAVRNRHASSQAGYEGQLAAAMPWSRLQDLTKIGCPTLVLHGGQDRLVSPSCGQLLADTIPGAQFTVLPDAAHQLFTDQPDAAAQVVLRFLQATTAH